MIKLPLTSLPVCYEPMGSYDRQLAIKLNEILDSYRQRINGLISNPNLPVYANNAAAITGGLVAGDFYRTGGDPDTVCVVH
jgi:hypothetical protein